MTQKNDLINRTNRKCNGCKVCQNICPRQCIEVKISNRGEFKPYILNDKCISCGLCESHCQILNNTIKSNDILSVYAAENTKGDIIWKSSSGGLFSAFAEYIINNNGIVIGAAFEKDFSVSLITVDSLQELEQVRRSKYVRSEIGDIFQTVRKHLNNDRLVLFAGMPCQVLGLRNYLKMDYSNLYIVELLCGGTPSPNVWIEYLKYQESVHDSVITGINFRDKCDSWLKYNMTIDFSNGEVYSVNHNSDPYFIMFLNHISLTDSCYNCSAKKVKVSDICLGDFWSAGRFLSDVNTKKGLSIVFVHTEKGQELLNLISGKIRLQKVTDIERAVECSPEYNNSIPKPKVIRKFFFRNLNKLDFNELVLKTEYRRNKRIRTKNRMRETTRKLSLGNIENKISRFLKRGNNDT